MQRLHGKPVLARVLERCAQIEGADLVICAVPDEEGSAPLEKIAIVSGARVFKGSERDVLRRYLVAAQMARGDVAVRVT